MKDRVLTFEQMQHLKELGVDISADSNYMNYNDDKLDGIELSHGIILSREIYRAFTFEDVFELLPTKIYVEIGTLKESLTRWPNSYIYSVRLLRLTKGYSVEYFSYRDVLHSRHGKTMLEAAYNMLCWLAENKLLRKEEK